MTFDIHPAADVFPPIEGEAFDALVADIAAHGLREPVWVTESGVLLDGRNRVRACEAAGVAVRSRVYSGDDPIAFIVSSNLARRHLTPSQLACVANDLLPVIEAEAKDRQLAGLKQNRPPTVLADRPEREPVPWSRDVAARMVGSSGRVVGRAKRVAEADPDLYARVKSGEVAVDAAEKQIRRAQAQAKEQEARELTLETVLSADAEGPGWRMLHGDFRARLGDIPDGSVDLIVTDPPYPAEFLPLWSDLSKHAARVLAPDGMVVALTGQIFLADVLDRLGENLTYGWVYCQPLPGQQSRIMGRHVLQSWKPWVAFTQGTWPSGRIGWHPDMLDPSARSKNRYRWEQDGDPAKMLIVELCPEGGTVLDPFAGTGSYGSATLEIGRRFIGVEQDPARFAACVERLDSR